MNRLKFVILVFGVFLISFGVVSFEISLTRIFSVMFSYHYVFLAVSLALFGLGLGGVLTRVLSWHVSLNRTFTVLASISLVLSFAISSFTLAAVYATESGVMGAALLIFLPFLIAGFLLSAVYRVFVSFSSVLYFVDLLGAALGALGVVILLNSVGPIEMVFIISMSASLASLLFAVASGGKKITLVALASIILMAFFVQLSTRYDPLSIRPHEDQFKELESTLADQSAGARIIESRWSAFGRTDVVEFDSDPHSKVIFVDGGAGTRMFHFNGDFNDSRTEVLSLKNSTQYFPYYFVNKGSALVIGPGGGIDVLTSLMGGMNHTTAIEVNPDVVGIVRDYSDYNGGIYTQYSNVHVDVDEGRSFVRRSAQKYDIIMLDIPITKTTQGAAGYALAENYLFTVNSFVDFLDHLNNDGVLSVVAHEPAEVYKLTSIAFSVLGGQRLSAQEIMQRIVVVEGVGHSGLPVFILKKTPFTNTQATFLYAKSNEVGLMPAYLPYVNGASSDMILTDLADGKISMDFLISQAPFDATPPTDDSPFFYKFDRGVPFTVLQLLIGSVVLSAAALALYIFSWARRLSLSWKKELQSLTSKFSLFRPYYFASLGLGFMLIEIPLIQRFIFFIGQPTLAVAEVLFSLLLAGGIGSLYSRRWNDQKLFSFFKVSLVIGIVVILYLLVLPSAFNVFLGYDSISRFFVAFGLIFPLGFLMGIPFPTGLRLVGKEFENDVAWMWCINGAFSVLGAVLALVLAMSFSFTAALLLGASVYVTVFLVGRYWAKGKIEVAEIEEATLKEQKEREKLEKKERRKQWERELWKKRGSRRPR